MCLEIDDTVKVPAEGTIVVVLGYSRLAGSSDFGTGFRFVESPDTGMDCRLQAGLVEWRVVRAYDTQWHSL